MAESAWIEQTTAAAGVHAAELQGRRHPVLGVDPASHPAQAARDKEIDTLVDFFGARVARDLREDLAADVTIGNNVVANVADQNDLVAGLAELLADDGLLSRDVVEARYLTELSARRIVAFYATSVRRSDPRPRR